MPLSFDFRSFSIFYYFFLRAQWDGTQLRRIKSIFTYSCSQDWFLPQLGSILQKKYQIIIKQVFTSIFEYIFSSKAIAKFSMIKIIDILQKFIRLIVFLNCSFYYFENTLLERPEQHSPVKREAANFSSDVYREEYSSLRANRSTTGACRTVLELWLLWFRKLIGADRGLLIAGSTPLIRDIGRSQQQSKVLPFYRAFLLTFIDQIQSKISKGQSINF